MWNGLGNKIKGAMSRQFFLYFGKDYSYLTKNFFSNKKLLLEHQEKNIL